MKNFKWNSLTTVISIVAIAGWFAAWKNKPPHQQTVPTTAATSAQRSSKNVSSAASNPLLNNERTKELSLMLNGVIEGASAGVTNQKLLDACKQALVNGDRDDRQRKFLLLLDHMKPEDAAGLHQVFLELHRNGQTYPQEYTQFAERWGEIDGKGALDYLFAEKPMVLPTWDYEHIMRGWAVKNPQEALDWIAANPDRSSNYGGKPDIFESWIKNDEQGAMNWLKSSELNEQEKYDCVQKSAQNYIIENGAVHAARWLAGLSGDDNLNTAAQQAFQNLNSNSLNQLDYETAAQVWKEVGNANWMNLEMFMQLGMQTSRTRTADAGIDGFTDALLKNQSEAELVTQLQRMKESAMIDPLRFIRMTQQIPEGKMKSLLSQALEENLEAESGGEE
jgi:hypothetical protein